MTRKFTFAVIASLMLTACLKETQTLPQIKSSKEESLISKAKIFFADEVEKKSILKFSLNEEKYGKINLVNDQCGIMPSLFAIVN